MNSKTSRRRVLVVEDNPDQARTLSMLVDLMGHEVRCAETGYAALETARSLRPEVVLLDLGLPGLDGFEVARRLRQEHGTAVRIIAVTAYASDTDRQESRDAGCELHLVKPADPKFIESLLGY
jgi:CheY-like chemotaxis protein